MRLREVPSNYHARANGEEMVQVKFLSPKKRGACIADMNHHARCNGVKLEPAELGDPP